MPAAAKQDCMDKDHASIHPLMELTQSDMLHVNEIILSRMISASALIPEISRHLIESGGKRLRPMITLASAHLCDYQGDHHLKLAAAVEFMHTATLLHDDVVDESNQRRGKSTARILWGNQASVLVGDFLLGQAFKMMVEVGSLECLTVLSNAAVIIAEGEVMQLSAAKHTATQEKEYLAIVHAKTAALFSAAAEVGAILANKDKATRTALADYGCNLGLAFQLIDDVLDYSGDSDILGKNIGDDFREGKITMPVILSFARSTKEERSFWQKTLEEGMIDNTALATARTLMQQHNSLNDTIVRARHFGTKARLALDAIADSPTKNAMINIIDFCINRVN